MHFSVSKDCMGLNELSLYIQPLQMCFSLQQFMHMHIHKEIYLIKLRVERLFYDRCFVLGFLMNVWLEVPEREESFTGHSTAERNSEALTANTSDEYMKARVSSCI